ncbi:unnamed protein product [Brachionus calyciflorus]|uniref:Uncharacterized protein n=1 Tax=Brachionus calyciflorus TaxID=104777 RepID=A0A814HI70_9BILA|nr:unnamed protein product [Brachionus calyciflorus]
MSNLNKETILNLKLSELNLMRVKDRKFIKITGKIDLNNELNDGKQLVIYSDESLDSILPNKFLLENGLELEDLEEIKPNSKNEIEIFKCLVDLSYLEDFELKNINLQHDLVQFFGYKDSSSTKIDCKFRAVYYRILKRTNLNKYYMAMNIQNSYLNKKLKN